MGKEEKEFFNPKGIPWEPVEGYPKGVYKKPLSVDKVNNVWTNLVKLEPGTETHEILTHDTWEEVWIIEGEMYDTEQKLSIRKGMYACRPPGMKHGPWITKNGVIILEVRYK